MVAFNRSYVFSVPVVSSCRGYPVMAVKSWQSSCGSLVIFLLSCVVSSWLSFNRSPVISIPVVFSSSGCHAVAVLLCLSSHGSLVMFLLSCVVSSWMSFNIGPDISVPVMGPAVAVLPWLFCWRSSHDSCCQVLAVFFWQSCHVTPLLCCIVMDVL